MEEKVTIPENTLSVVGLPDSMDEIFEAMKQVLERRPDCVSLWLKQVYFEIGNGNEVLAYYLRNLLEDRLWDQLCLTDCGGHLESLSMASSNRYPSRPFCSEKTWIKSQNLSSGTICGRGSDSAANEHFERQQQEHPSSSPTSSNRILEVGGIPVVPTDSKCNRTQQQRQVAPEHLIFCKTRKLCLLQCGWRGPAGRARSTSDNIIYKQGFWDGLGHVLGNNLAPHLSHLGLYFDSSVNRLRSPMVK